MTFIKR